MSDHRALRVTHEDAYAAFVFQAYVMNETTPNRVVLDDRAGIVRVVIGFADIADLHGATRDVEELAARNPGVPRAELQVQPRAAKPGEPAAVESNRRGSVNAHVRRAPAIPGIHWSAVAGGLCRARREVGLGVQVPDSVGFEPAGLGERDAFESHMLHGPVKRAAKLDERLQRRHHDFRLPQVFPRARHVKDGARWLVQIPLTGLVEQFQCILDVAGKFDFRVGSRAGDLELRLHHGQMRVVSREIRLQHYGIGVVLPARPHDALHLEPGMSPPGNVNEFDVLRVSPPGHPYVRCLVALLAIELRMVERTAPGADGATVVDIQLAKVRHGRGRFPPSSGIRLPSGDQPSTAEDHLVPGGCLIDDRTDLAARILRRQHPWLFQIIGAAVQNDATLLVRRGCPNRFARRSSVAKGFASVPGFASFPLAQHGSRRRAARPAARAGGR